MRNFVKWPQVWLWLLLFLPWENVGAAEIAIIKSNDIGPYNQAIAGFKAGIRADFQEYDLKGNINIADRVMQEIIRRPPALIFAVGSLAVSKARQWVTDVPIVCTMVLNPEIKDAGERLTFISMEAEPEIQLKGLLAIIPKIKSVGMLYSRSTENAVARIQSACEKAGVGLLARKLERPEEVPEAVGNLLSRIHALWLIPDELVVNKESLQYMLLTTLENKIPFLTYTQNFVKAGALMSFSVDYMRIGRQAAMVSNKILQGNGSLGKVLPPEETDLSVNLNTAQRLEIDIPQTIIESARYVFQ